MDLNRQNRWIKKINAHIYKQKSLYLFVTVLLMMGIIFGAIIVNVLDATQKAGLLHYLNSFFKVLDKNEIADSQIVFQHKLGEHLKTLGLMWILGLSVIGIPFLLLLIFIKGLVMGFTVGFLVNQLSWKGLWFAFVSVVPQNIFFIPALIVIAVSGIHFSTHIVRNRIVQHKGTLFPQLFSFSLLVTFMALVMIFSTGVEAYVSPKLMKFALPQILQ